MTAEIEQVGQQRGDGDGHDAGRDSWQVAREDEHQCRAAHADDERQPDPRADLTEEAHRLLERGVAGQVHAHELAGLSDGDGEGEPHDEAVQDGLGEELGDQAEPGQAGEHEDAAGEQRQGDRECEVAMVAARRGEWRHRRRRDDGHRRTRSDDEVPGPAEEGVGDEGQGRGVQAVLRGHAGDPGVGQRLGYEQRPDRQCGEHVAGQPASLVVGQPAGRRQQSLQQRPPLPRPGERLRVAPWAHVAAPPDVCG